MDAGRALADEQLLGDPPVRVALDEEREDLALPGREAMVVRGGRLLRGCVGASRSDVGSRDLDARTPRQRLDPADERERAQRVAPSSSGIGQCRSRVTPRGAGSEQRLGEAVPRVRHAPRVARPVGSVDRGTPCVGIGLALRSSGLRRTEGSVRGELPTERVGIGAARRPNLGAPPRRPPRRPRRRPLSSHPDRRARPRRDRPRPGRRATVSSRLVVAIRRPVQTGHAVRRGRRQRRRCGPSTAPVRRARRRSGR